MTTEGEDILQLTFGDNHDTKTTTLESGDVAFVRWSRSYELLSSCGVSNDISLNKIAIMKKHLAIQYL